jgi:hypothetical protein
MSRVAAATSTVAGIVKPFTNLAASLSFLDKPTSLAVPTPMTVMPNRGFTSGSGLDNSMKLSLDPNAMISVDKSRFAGSNTRPTWREVLAVPSLIKLTSFTQATAVDSVIWAFPVRPNFARSSGTTYYPGALAYNSNFFKFWRGSIQYGFHFACPANVTARVRISFLPSVGSITAPPEDQAGDVMSKIVSITGDTMVSFPIEYLADTFYKKCESLNVADTSNNQSIGRIVITVLNEVVSVNTSTVTPIYLSVWMAAGPNFQFMMPDDYPANWSIDTSGVVIRKQATIRALMDSANAPIVPTALAQESGVTSPEAFTGPLDLLHRTTIASTIVDGDQFLCGLRPGTIKFWVMSQFLGYAGAWRYKVFPATGNARMALSFVTEAANPSSISWQGGVALADSANALHLEVESPYYDMYAWRETVSTMDVDLPQALEFESTDTTGTHILCEAVGDDLSLGPYFAPFPIKYTAPPPADHGMERIATSRDRDGSRATKVPAPSASPLI